MNCVEPAPFRKKKKKRKEKKRKEKKKKKKSGTHTRSLVWLRIFCSNITGLTEEHESITAAVIPSGVAITKRLCPLMEFVVCVP